MADFNKIHSKQKKGNCMTIVCLIETPDEKVYPLIVSPEIQDRMSESLKVGIFAFEHVTLFGIDDLTRILHDEKVIAETDKVVGRIGYPIGEGHALKAVLILGMMYQREIDLLEIGRVRSESLRGAQYS
jgi:hypothetical protein